MKQIQKTIRIFVFIFCVSLFTETVFANNTYAESEPTLTISTSSLSAVSLQPGVFGQTSQTINVSTDNYTGYNLSLTTSGTSTDLVNINNSGNVIPTITLPEGREYLLSSEFSVGYGFSTNNTNYYPVPVPGGAAFQIGASSTAGTSQHTLTFGVKIDDGVASGTYQNTFVITAVVNNPQYSITYDQNITGTVANMPSNQQVTMSSTGVVTLPNNVPTTTGATFLGWDTNSTATTPTYPTGTTNTITLDATTSNAISLFAIWQVDSGGGGSGTIDDPYIDNGEYDPENMQEGVTVYPNVPGQPQVTVDENGNVTEFVFTDAENGVSLEDGAMNTGYVPFRSGNDFEIRIKASFPPQQNNNSPLGILLDIRNRDSNSGDYLQVTYAKNKTVPRLTFRTKTYDMALSNFTYNGVTYSDYLDLKISVVNGTWTITYYTYTVSGGNLVATPHDVNVNNINSLNIPEKEVFLGYSLNTSGQVIRKATATIYEFTMRDL